MTWALAWGEDLVDLTAVMWGPKMAMGSARQWESALGWLSEVGLAAVWVRDWAASSAITKELASAPARVAGLVAGWAPWWVLPWAPSWEPMTDKAMVMATAPEWGKY